MKYVNATVLSASDATSQTSSAIDSDQLISSSFHAYFGDATAAGSVKIQASNDLCPIGYIPTAFTPTQWVDVPSATVAVVAGAPVLLTLSQISYRWMRVVFTQTTPGSTTITVNMFAISI